MSPRHKLLKLPKVHRAANGSRVRSAITNGSRLLDGIDGRLAPARRLKDLRRDISDDLGGYDTLTTTRKLLVDQTASLTLRREQYDAAMLSDEPVDLNDYLKIVNAERRALVALGLKRATKQAPDLDDYLRNRNGHARPSSRIRIDRMEGDG